MQFKRSYLCEMEGSLYSNKNSFVKVWIGNYTSYQILQQQKMMSETMKKRSAARTYSVHSFWKRIIL